jgi:hypothetical protein
MIKDQMDKKFGSPWHVVVGKGFSYNITYEVSRTHATTRCSQHVLCMLSLHHLLLFAPPGYMGQSPRIAMASACPLLSVPVRVLRR